MRKIYIKAAIIVTAATLVMSISSCSDKTEIQPTPTVTVETQQTTNLPEIQVPAETPMAIPEPLIFNDPSERIKTKTTFMGLFTSTMEPLLLENDYMKIFIDKGIFYPERAGEYLLALMTAMEEYTGIPFKREEGEKTQLFVSSKYINPILNDGIIYLGQEEMFLDGGYANARLLRLFSELLLLGYPDVGNESFKNAFHESNVMNLLGILEIDSLYNGFFTYKNIENGFLSDSEEFFNTCKDLDAKAAGFRLAAYVNDNLKKTTIQNVMQYILIALSSGEMNEFSEYLKRETGDDIFVNLSEWSMAEKRFNVEKIRYSKEDLDGVCIYPFLIDKKWVFSDLSIDCSEGNDISFGTAMLFYEKLTGETFSLKGSVRSDNFNYIDAVLRGSRNGEKINLIENKTTTFDIKNVNNLRVYSYSNWMIFKFNNTFAAYLPEGLGWITDSNGVMVEIPDCKPAMEIIEASNKPVETPITDPVVVVNPTSPPNPAVVYVPDDNPVSPDLPNDGAKDATRFYVAGPPIPMINKGTYLISGKETTLSNDRIEIIIDAGVVYSAGLLEYMDDMVDRVSEATGLDFFKKTRNKITVRIWGGYRTEAQEEYISLSSEYAIAEGGNTAWNLAFEMTRFAVYRDQIPYVIYMGNVTPINATIEYHIKKSIAFPEVFITAYAMEIADGMKVGLDNAFLQFKTFSNADEYMENPKESFKTLYGDGAKSYALRFYYFLEEQYGKSLQKEIMAEVMKISSSEVTDDIIIGILEKLDRINDKDVFNAFGEWHSANKGIFSSSEGHRDVDFRDIEVFDVVPEVTYRYNSQYPWLCFDYDGSIVLDFEKGFELMQMYGSESIGIVAQIKVGEVMQFEFFDVAGGLIKKVNIENIRFSPDIDGAVSVRITGKPGRIEITFQANQMNTEALWKPSNERITELPPTSIVLSGPTPSAGTTPSTGTTPTPSSSPSQAWRSTNELYDFLDPYRTVETAAGNIDLNIGIHTGDENKDYNFFILANIDSSLFNNLFILEIFPDKTEVVKSQLEAHMKKMALDVIAYASMQTFTGGYSGGPKNVVNCAWVNYSAGSSSPSSFRWISSDWNWLIMMD